MIVRRACVVLVAIASLVACGTSAALELPATCRDQAPLAGKPATIAELRQRVESIGETDPAEAVRILCVTIPRVAAEYGGDSLELAQWAQNLATPLIAYFDKFAEARALLEFAQPILIKKLGPDAPEIAELHVAGGWMFFRQGRLAESRAEWAAALGIREVVPGEKQIELQKVLVGLSQVELSQRDFAAARASLERAQTILSENRETASEAAAAIENALANISMLEEKYGEARAHAERLLEIEQQLPYGPAQLVPAHVLLGRALEQLDEFDRAEATLRRAVEIAESNNGPLQRNHLAALTQLTNLLNSRGKPREALPFATSALEVAETELGPEAPTLVKVLDTLAGVHLALGELPPALTYYQRADSIVMTHRDDVQKQILVQHYRGLGNAYAAVGERAQADASFAMALTIAGDDATLSMERAATLLARARAIPDDDDASAQELLGQAHDLFASRLPAGHPTLLRVANELCAVELRARPHRTPGCDEADRMLRAMRTADPGLRYAVYENASRRAELNQDSAGAYDLAVRALAAAESLGTPAPTWQAQFRMAQLLNQRGERSLAILFGKQSLLQIEQLRTWFRGEESRLEQSFLLDKVATYRTVSDWLMQAGRIDEALQVLDLLKAEELYDFALRDANDGTGASNVLLTPAEHDLWSTYTNVLRADATVGSELDRFARLAESDRLTPAERRNYGQLLIGQADAQSGRALRIREFVRDQSQAYPRTATARLVSAERLSRDLRRYGPDAALGVYLLTKSQLKIIIATSQGQSVHESTIDLAALRQDIGLYLDAIAARRDVSVMSRRLYDEFVRPLDVAARRAGAKLLVLWPDDALRYLPFAALSDGEHYLVEKYALELYSVDRQRNTESSVRSPPTVRGLGLTRAIAGYQALPAVADELCSVIRGPIAGLSARSAACATTATGNGALAGEGYADAAFTEQRLVDLLSSPAHFSVLHIGTHFSLRPGNAMRSYLVLGDGSHLTLDHINALDFTGIGLATLSGCQTGMGGAVLDDGREVEGLNAIVLRKGAQRVIASLWRVEDESTALLMRSMYTDFASKADDVAVALQAAQRSLLDGSAAPSHDYSHPYYWAGFIVSGSRR